MKNIPPSILEKGRVTAGLYGSDASYKMMGAFFVFGPCSAELKIISSGHGNEWEHVSVSLRNRYPNWPEMCFVKDLFWDDDEVVMQLHPAKENYVNQHQHCLHLWKPATQSIPLPPMNAVGFKADEMKLGHQLPVEE